jgi:hypothetical protein
MKTASLTAITCIISLITTANETKAISLTNSLTSQYRQPLDTGRIAFLEGLLNKAVRGAVSGEAALKETCRSNNQDIFDRDQCKKAMKEVTMARSKYPAILEIIDKHKDTPNNLPSISNGKYQALTTLEKYCENKIAERAAKTMRYWGTSEVGDYTLTSLNNMQANRYKEVLSSCKKTSWVYSSINKIESNASKNISAINTLAASSECNQNISPNGWNSKLLAEVQTKKERYSEARNISASLADLENPANSRSESRLGIDKSKLQTYIISLDKSIQQCQFLAQQGENILAKRKRDAETAERKRLADQQAANARAAKAAAAQRARNQKAAAAAAEKSRREKALQQNIEGVVLE